MHREEFSPRFVSKKTLYLHGEKKEVETKKSLLGSYAFDDACWFPFKWLKISSID